MNETKIVKIVVLMIALLGCYLIVDSVGVRLLTGIFLLMWANNYGYVKK